MIKAAAAAGLPRRARRRARGAHRHPPRRRRHRDHLPREGRRRVASSSRRKVRARKDGAAVPLDELDKKLLNLMQGSFPLEPRPYAARRRGWRRCPRTRCMRRVQRLLDERIIRQVTPIFDTRVLGYSSMLVAAKVDPENPHRAAKIINSHPGVSHNYLRNHDFNIWFTIATEPDSKLGLQGTLDVLAGADRRRVGAPAAHAQALQDPDGPRDGEGHDGPRRGRRRRRTRWSPTRSSCPTSTSRSSARSRATCRWSPSPTRPRPPRSASPRTSCSSTSSRCRSARRCAAWPRSSSTAAPASPPTAWASGTCPRSGSWRWRR